MAPHKFAAAIAVALSLVSGAAAGQETGVDDKQVVARVNGEDVLLGEVLRLAASLPPQYQQQFSQIYPLLVRRVVDFRLAGKAGRAQGMMEDEDVKARIAEAEDRAIREVYLERKIEERVTDAATRAQYAKFLEENPPKTEQRASHILLKTEAEALEVIAKLDQGSDFAELAKESSTGPSADNGGDLGYFTADQMVPEFADAAAKMQPGEYSKAPTQTQFGWHVIKLEDRREVAQPAFADVEDQLREELTRTAVETILAELRADAQVEILPAGETPPGALGAAQ
ncbi:MAG TPA: peptidylprolyl isomerase [Kiloniellales bacterium]|jgi:peptidyl-prolyl cis-trans isomerase C